MGLGDAEMDIGTKQHIHTTVDCVMNYVLGHSCYYGYFGRFHRPTFKALWMGETLVMNEWLMLDYYSQHWNFHQLTNFNAWH